MKTEIYAKKKDSKIEGDGYIEENDEQRLAKSLRNIEGVANVRFLEVSDVIDFPVGFVVEGEYDPSRLSQAICSHGYSILKIKIKR